jgi:hypothetical protein
VGAALDSARAAMARACSGVRRRRTCSANSRSAAFGSAREARSGGIFLPTSHGLMESFLVDGRQDLVDPARPRYGQSITDACMGWEMTVPVIEELAPAVRARRRASR